MVQESNRKVEVVQQKTAVMHLLHLLLLFGKFDESLSKQLNTLLGGLESYCHDIDIVPAGSDFSNHAIGQI